MLAVGWAAADLIVSSCDATIGPIDVHQLLVNLSLLLLLLHELMSDHFILLFGDFDEGLHRIAV